MKKIKFEFDQKLKLKEFSSKYFISTQKIFELNNLGNDVTLKFFHFSNNVCVAGIDECLQLINFCISKENLSRLDIYYVEDGSITNSGEPVLIIRGNYQYFGHLENIIDGILSRRSSIATNCKNFVDLVGSENLLFMADRSDDYSLQKYDGYSAYIGGVRKFCTKQHIEFIKDNDDIEYSGTIPHALIQQFKGDIVKTLKAYKSIFDGKIVALIDFNNDCINEINQLSKLDFNVDYIRIDTSKKNIDKSLINHKNDPNYYGVNEHLISLCRKKLDEIGMKETKIIISSNIDIDQIKKYQSQNTPIDIYGVGKSLLKINVTFTADLIKSGNEYFSKFGRDQDIEKYLINMKKCKN